MGSLIRFGPVEDPCYFALEVGPDESGFVVYRKAADLHDGVTLLDRYRYLAAGIPIQFRDALLSLHEDRRIGDQIGNLRPKFRRHGFILSAWYLETPMGPYVIRYSATGRPPSAAVEKLLKKVLPPEIASFIVFQVVEVTTL